MKSYIIKSSGELVEYLPANGRTFTLEEMQKAVGGYIERAATLRTGTTIWVNEEGRLKGLPINAEATLLAYGERSGEVYAIVGDALVCNKKMVA